MNIRSPLPAAETSRLDLPAYDEIALVLQGGGALGSYQAGVYEGLAERGVTPTRIAGISIGALNAAVIAGNPPERRVAALRGFWDTICQPADALGLASALPAPPPGVADIVRKWSSLWAATRAAMMGQRGFFAPRAVLPVPGLVKAKPDQVSYYETRMLKQTLLRFADFDLINRRDVHVSVGAVNVRTGNLVYFDNRHTHLEPEHFMASGALPPGFPAVAIGDDYFWDGGLVSNTPLTDVVSDLGSRNTLVFQVDLWSARGGLPCDFLDVAERAKDIQYSSRTRAVTDSLAEKQHNAGLFKAVLDSLPDRGVLPVDLLKRIEAAADGKAVNVVHLIYKDKFYEGHYKDFEFSSDTMTEHWSSGLNDIRQSLAHTDWFAMPTGRQRFATHDIHRKPGQPDPATRMA